MSGSLIGLLAAVATAVGGGALAWWKWPTQRTNLIVKSANTVVTVSLDALEALSKENERLQERLENLEREMRDELRRLRGDLIRVRQERDRLANENSELRGRVDELEARVQRIDHEEGNLG